MTNGPSRSARLQERFADLHWSGTFLMPNAWDIGSARILATLGFEAIATTSSGFGASLGRMDQEVTLTALWRPAARELLDSGTSGYVKRALSGVDRAAAFGGRTVGP